jgi:uncharacterized protein DUF4129
VTGGSPWRALRATGLLAALLAVVAIASRAGPDWGGTPSGGGGASDAFLDVALGFLGVAAAAALLLLAAGLRRPRRRRPEPDREGVGGPLGRRRARLAAAGLALALLGIAIGVLVALGGSGTPSRGTEGAAPATTATTPASRPARMHRSSGGPDRLGVAVAAAAAAIALGLLGLAARRRDVEPPGRGAGRSLGLAVREVLPDVAAETDPRRAVIAAYVGMERSLGAHGLPRRAPETPVEYATRILAAAGLSREPAERLTDLYERARFGGGPVIPMMRQEALGALGDIRRDLGDEG